MTPENPEINTHSENLAAPGAAVQLDNNPLDTWLNGDTDGDGDVDSGDLTTAIINFTGASNAAAVVPDPSGLLMLVLTQAGYSYILKKHRKCALS